VLQMGRIHADHLTLSSLLLVGLWQMLLLVDHPVRRNNLDSALPVPAIRAVNPTTWINSGVTTLQKREADQFIPVRTECQRPHQCALPQ
jgi:hypothetical protein